MAKLVHSAMASLCLLGGVLAATSATAQESQHPQRILQFRTMYGVDGPFVGDANPVRSINGDDLPWEIAKSIRGRLESSGRLQIRVRGLVFKDDPSVPEELRNTNDEEEFRGLVSCLTEVGDAVEEENVITEGFPADTDGNSSIKAEIELPDPCVAPIVMVLAGSEDKWFAMTGFESEEEEEEEEEE
jgi:hypothetical protein